ncbi:putative cytosine-specific methyltransferase [Burkholderia thailandensis MSMB59]|nr:putative cytosine-specific methyltransferase [Burkholderia thailandensis MSMB59]
MSFIFSRALVEEFSQANCSGIDAFVQSNPIRTDRPSLSLDRTTAVYRRSPYGMTYAHSTGAHGAELLIALWADFPVKPIPLQLEEGTLRMISGRKCDGSWQMSLPGTYLPRTSNASRSTPRPTISNRWATPLDASRSTPPSWVARIAAHGSGWLPTPTAKANHDAPSMRKWPAYAAWQDWLGGKTSPATWEYMMGWPIGWTDLRPLATDRFQSWLQQHSPFSNDDETT